MPATVSLVTRAQRAIPGLKENQVTPDPREILAKPEPKGNQGMPDRKAKRAISGLRESRVTSGPRGNRAKPEPKVSKEIPGRKVNQESRVSPAR